MIILFNKIGDCLRSGLQLQEYNPQLYFVTFASPKSNQKGDHECRIRPDSSYKPTAPGAESVGFHTIRVHPPHLSHSIRFY